MSKKPFATNRAALVDLVTKLTINKKEATVAQTRRFVKNLLLVDELATLEGRPSPLVMLRREVRGRGRVRKYLSTKNKK